MTAHPTKKFSLRALRTHTGGNVLAIAAASVLPILAIVGGTVDMSRAYMAQAQLQSACDAAVLAGRRASSRTGTYGTAERSKADRMFNANFEPKRLSVTQSDFKSQREEDASISGVATATLPTVIMGAFSFEAFSLSANCLAELEVSNTDVMFVLDTTGSMRGAPLEGLRDAVRDFHSSMASSLMTPESRIRYGFVPYAQSVNAKYLVANRQLPTSYFGVSSIYSTREAIFRTEDFVGTGSKTYGATETITSSSAQCTGNGSEWSTDYNRKTISGRAPNLVATFYERESYTASPGSVNGSCKRRRVTQPVRRVYKLTGFVDHETSMDTSGLSNLKAISIAYPAFSDSWVSEPGTYDAREMGALNEGNSYGFSSRESSWNGCVMERSTVRSTNWDPIPNGARDLDVVSAPEPGVPESHWAPLWTDVMFNRHTGNTYSSDCPQEMRAFTPVEMTSSTVPAWVDIYLNGLVANGSTYHDIGMIWGARLTSKRGIMTANVNDEPLRSSTRHLIFMTDGKLQANRDTASAYGIERLTNLVSSPNTDNATLSTIHQARFRAACNAARNEDVVIWMIAFGTEISDDMRYCATGDRVFLANNTNELRTQFKSIASQIATLRLSN